jgi:hypothetical protein
MEDDPYPRFNGAILFIAQIIKFVMTFGTESELAALFITAREIIPHCQTLINMGWPQPKSPIQTDNSTAVGITNKTIIPCRSKMMDMRFWWLRCRTSQDQFVITGMQAPRTGLTTTPNITQIPTMKPIIVLMQDTGLQWALESIPSHA